MATTAKRTPPPPPRKAAAKRVAAKKAAPEVDESTGVREGLASATLPPCLLPNIRFEVPLGLLKIEQGERLLQVTDDDLEGSGYQFQGVEVQKDGTVIGSFSSLRSTESTGASFSYRVLKAVAEEG